MEEHHSIQNHRQGPEPVEEEYLNEGEDEGEQEVRKSVTLPKQGPKYTAPKAAPKVEKPVGVNPLHQQLIDEAFKDADRYKELDGMV